MNLKEKSKIIEQREGIVLEVFENIFLARLIDINDKLDDIYTFFEFKEILEKERIYIKCGAIFYFDLGTLNGVSFSKITFKKEPIVTLEDIKLARKRAVSLRKKLGLE